MEEWRDIKGYEGLYQVSNLGRVKSLGNGRTHKAERILRNCNRNNNHLSVDLCKNGERKSHMIHILVAQAFIPNPENKQIVHHIDKNPTNNNVDNLMWCTPKEHMGMHMDIYEKAIKASINARKGKHSWNYGKKLDYKNGREKKVNQYSKEGVLIKTWESIAEASKTLKIMAQNICHCCSGGAYRKGIWKKCESAGGFKWKYA